MDKFRSRSGAKKSSFKNLLKQSNQIDFNKIATLNSLEWVSVQNSEEEEEEEEEEENVNTIENKSQ